MSEERRLEVIRLQEAERKRLEEVESLQKNGDELRRQLKETVEANDLVVRTAKEHEHEHEQLVGNLIAEVERVNELILGT